MKKHAPILSGFPYFLHGGDYNPDQWWHEMPDIVDDDMKFARLAGCNAFPSAFSRGANGSRKRGSSIFPGWTR